MIDFGLSKRFSDPRTGLHIKYGDGRGLTGTARYVSINCHLGLGKSKLYKRAIKARRLRITRLHPNLLYEGNTSMDESGGFNKARYLQKDNGVQAEHSSRGSMRRH